MDVARDEIAAVLSEYNPWWRGLPIPDLPPWRRAAFAGLKLWATNPPADRAVALSGARQIGKTTLMRQVIDAMLAEGVPAANILYATFDHPILKLAGIDPVLAAWREREPAVAGPEYLFLDEAQFLPDWGTWVKLAVDFRKSRRIVFTGSAMTLARDGPESGVGRWHTIRMTTLSFYEYLALRQLDLPPLPPLGSLREAFDWPVRTRREASELAAPYVGHFHEYLLRGGFPQTALVDSITRAQQLLREDIIDKVLKRDMTAFFGVRRPLELEYTFLYLCRNDGALLDYQALCSNLQISRRTAERYIDLLEASHLIYRLAPFGYGKEVLRGRFKIYLADPAMAPAVMMRGKPMLEDPAALGIATEAAVLKHLFARYYRASVSFSYWQDKRRREVDLVADTGRELVPFEVKYRSTHTGAGDLKGLIELCRIRELERGYVVTRVPEDFGELEGIDLPTRILRVPAPLLCYWMGESELRDAESA